MMNLYSFGGALILLILFCVIVEGQRDGMLESKMDWAVFAGAMSSFGVIAVVAWWFAQIASPGQRVGTAISLFVAGMLIVGSVFSWVNRRKQAKRMKVSGVISQREFNRRVDTVLAEIELKREFHR